MASNANADLGPLPKTLTGGCLCTAVRYRVTFPPDHDFASQTAICQCTQCRRQTGSLFLTAFQVPTSAVEWERTSSSTGTGPGTGTEYPVSLNTYSASPSATRGFCAGCGSFLFWRSNEDPDNLSLAVGSVDPLYLFGEGAGEERGGGEGVPEEGFGRAICNGRGVVEFCGNEIKGVTDDMPLLFKAKRHLGSSDDE